MTYSTRQSLPIAGVPPENYLPAEDFPRIPGERFRTKYKTDSPGKKTPTVRRPEVDLALPVFRAMLDSDGLYAGGIERGDPASVYKTIRSELALLYKRYTGKRVQLTPDKDTLVTVISDRVILEDEEGHTRDFGTFPISLRVHHPDQRYLYIHIGNPDVEPSPYHAHIHPHVVHNSPCLGDGMERVRRAIRCGYLTDLFTLLHSHLHTYNPFGAVLPLRAWDAESMSCSGCGQTAYDMDDFHICSCGEGCCESCLMGCSLCDRDICPSCALRCRGCRDDYCRECFTPCDSRNLCKACEEEEEEDDEEEDGKEEAQQEEDCGILGFDDGTPATAA
jgi:hypothetical protein